MSDYKFEAGKTYNLRGDGPKIESRGFPKKQDRPGKIDKSDLPTLPRRSLYQ